MRAFYLVIAVLLVAGCSSHEVVHKPMRVAGERKDAQGEVVERILVDETFYVTTHPFTPEGPHRTVNKVDRKFYLEEKGKPRRDISWLNEADCLSYSFQPVENSRLWVGTDVVRPTIDEDKQLYVLVFNADGIVTQREFKEITWEWNMQFRPGNRAIVLRIRSQGIEDVILGYKEYDVVADTVTDLGQEDGAELFK